MGFSFSLGWNATRPKWEVHQVKCIVWSLVWGKDMFMGPKSNTLDKHARKKKATNNMPHIGVKKNKWYINKKCCHV